MKVSLSPCEKFVFSKKLTVEWPFRRQRPVLAREKRVSPRGWTDREKDGQADEMRFSKNHDFHIVIHPVISILHTFFVSAIFF